MHTYFQHPTQPISIFLEDQSVDVEQVLHGQYDLKITLDSTAQHLVFEPFVSIIRFALARLPDTRAKEILALPKTFTVLRPVITHFINDDEPSHREPINPDEMSYEQIEIYKALGFVLQQCFSEIPAKIAITHAEHISASAFEFLQIEEYRTPDSLQLDFFLTSAAFQNLKISQGFATQIKRRHLSAPLGAGKHAQSTESLTIKAQPNKYWQYLRNSVALFSAGEMQLLCTVLEQTDKLSPDQNAELLRARMYASVILRDAARCHLYIQELQHISLTSLPALCATRSLKAICIAYLCLQEYSLGEKAAARYKAFAQEHTQKSDAVLANFYEFCAQCFNGSMEKSARDIFKLQQDVEQQGWLNLSAFVKCSLWFNEHLLETDISSVIDYCLTSITEFERMDNIIGLSTAHHHISIVLGINGKPRDAIAHINRALKLTQQCGLTNRIHNTLNGLAFLLNGLGQTDSAREALEAAYPLVLADGSFDQICTTLYNLAMVAFYGNDQQTTIQLVDDLFSVMEYRNMTSTRFRTKGELLALQALAAYIDGDRRLPFAIRPQLIGEQCRSHEGEAFTRCIALITRSFSADEAEHFFIEIADQFSKFRQNTHLELLALRLLVIYLTDLGELQRAQVWAQQGLKQCKQYHLESRQVWFKHSDKKTLMTTTVQPRQAILLAQRQMGIDALKLENGLLNTLAAFNDSALRSGSIDELVNAFLSNMQRMINVYKATIELSFIDGEIINREVENELNDDVSAIVKEMRFSFQFIGGSGQLSVLFLGDLVNRSHDAKNIIHKICQQLAKAIEFVLERLDSYQLAYHDQLTQAYNRAAFDEDMERLLNERPVQRISLAFIDLDKFKTVNDTYGHQMGDQFLQAFVEILATKVRLNDRVYRIGGDEFLVCFQEVSLPIAQDVLQRFSEQFFSATHMTSLGIDVALGLGCSIGIIESRLASSLNISIDELLAQADKLMYQAKRSTHKKIASKVLTQNTMR